MLLFKLISHGKLTAELSTRRIKDTALSAFAFSEAAENSPVYWTLAHQTHLMITRYINFHFAYLLNYIQRIKYSERLLLSLTHRLRRSRQ